VLLTTHYLEEAEALCGRIAMLKQGRVVALDRTAALLAAHGGSSMLRLQDRRCAAAVRWPRAARVHRPHRAGCRHTTPPRSSSGWRPCARPACTWRPGDGRAALEDVFVEIMNAAGRVE
jgi:ABC-2 type transport system ATP-binding protein